MGEESEIEAGLIDLESARARCAIALFALLQGKGGGEGKMESERGRERRRASSKGARNGPLGRRVKETCTVER